MPWKLKKPILEVDLSEDIFILDGASGTTFACIEGCAVEGSDIIRVPY